MSVNNNGQNADKSILDQFNKQTYLGNAFAVPVLGVSLSNTNETGVFLLENPSTSSKAAFVNLRRYSSSAEQVLVKAYFNPTVSTTGTAATPVNLRPASTTTSSVNSYANGQFTTSANGTAADGIGIPADYYVTVDNSLLFIIDPGTTLLFTVTALVSTTVFNGNFSWYELGAPNP
jgi:hypothetical protein